MTTENIDVVVKSGGTRRVVRDLSDIGDAATRSQTTIDRLQRSINGLNTSNFQRQLTAVQASIAGVGKNQLLSQFQTQLQGVTTQLAAMNTQLNTTGGAMNRHFGGASGGRGGIMGAIGNLGMLKATVVGVMAVLGVSQITKWADAWTEASGKIMVFAQSGGEAAAVMDRIFQTSMQVRQPLQSMAALYHRLSIAGRELGVSQEQMLQFTSLVGKTLAIQGTSMTQARGALLQLSQAMGEGIVRAQEFNSMMENAPLILKVVADNIKGVDGSIAKLRKMMLDGQLTSKVFFDAYMKGSADINKMFEKAPITFGQGMTVLVNGIEKFLGKLNEATGASNAFGAAMQSFGTMLGDLDSSIIHTVKTGQDSFTSLADVFSVIGPPITEFFKTRLNELDVYFGTSQSVAAEIGQSLDLTFSGVVRSVAASFDAIMKLFTTMAAGVIRVFGGMPAAMDQVGKMMFNAVVGHIESIVNVAITGINKLWAIVGKGAISTITLERANIDKTVFENYGKSIMGSVQAGAEMQGNFLLNGVNKVFNKANEIAKKRTHDAFRAAERGYQSLNNKLGMGAPAVAGGGKGSKGAAQKAATSAAQAAQKEIQEMLDRYKLIAAQMAEVERHKEVMLKQSYDQGLINYAAYNSQLATMQQSSFERQKLELVGQQTLIREKMEELKPKLKAKGQTDPQIANTIQDLETKLQGLNHELEKLGNKNTERLGANLVAALQPGREFLDTMTKSFEAQELNNAQSLEKIVHQKNINGLSERELFIQQEMLKLTDKYNDQLKEVEDHINKLSRDGVFNDLANPATKKLFDDLVAMSDRIAAAMDSVVTKAPKALGDAFDQDKIQDFAKDLNTGLTDAIMNAGKDGAKGLRQFLVDALIKKPFRIVLEGVLKPITMAISNAIMPVMNNIMGGIMGMLGGGGGGGGVLGAASGGGGGMLGNLASIGGMFSGSAFGSGAIAGFSSLMGGGGGAALSVGASSIGAGSIMSGLGMIAGVLGPIALGVGALYKLFGSDKPGGPKVEGSAGGPMQTDIGHFGNELDTMAQQTVAGLQSSFDKLAANMRLQGGVQFGLGLSTDPRGTAPSMVDLSASRGGQIIYGGVNTEVPRNEEGLKEVIATQAVIAMLQGLEASGMDRAFSEYFGRITEGMEIKDMMPAFETLSVMSKFVDTMQFVGVGFGSLATASIAAKIHVTELAGGVDKLAAGMNNYRANFLSVEEQRLESAKAISRALTSAGIHLTANDVLTSNKVEFRKMVEAVDLTTSWGRNMFAVLMDVSGAFAELHQNASGTAEVIDTLGEARDRLRTAYENEKSALESTRDKMEGFTKTFKEFGRSLQQGSLSPLTPGEKYAVALDDYNKNQAAMQAGGPGAIKASEQFTTIASALLEASQLFNASGGTYGVDFARVTADTARATSTAELQYNVATQQLVMLDFQVGHLIDIKEGIYNLTDTITQLERMSGASINYGATVNQMYMSILDRLPDYEGGQYWVNRLAGGESVDSVRRQISAFAPGHAGGLSRVPYDNYLMRAHQGETILNRNDAAIYRNGSNGMDLSGLLVRIDRLCAEVEELRTQHADGVNAEIEAMMRTSQANATQVAEGVVNGQRRGSWMAYQRDKATVE